MAALWDLEASRIHQPLKPVCIGCIFEGEEEAQNPKQAESIQLLNQFRTILLTDGPIDPLQTSVSATQEVVGKSCDSHVTCNLQCLPFTLKYIVRTYVCTYVCIRSLHTHGNFIAAPPPPP